MVDRATAVISAWSGSLLAQAERMQITRLDPAARARIIGSLVLLTIGGVALIVLAWLALRVGRRHVLRADPSALPTRRPPHPDDWATPPLAGNNARGPGRDQEDE